MKSQAHDPNRSGWIPWVFVGGMLVVILVNGVLIFSALSTFTGVSVGQAYDRGRDYNRVLEEAARQDALGWSLRVAREADRLAITARDRDGAPVAGVVEAHLLRPLDGQRVALPDASGAGRFVLDLPELRAGQWEFRGLLISAAGERHDLRQRFTLP
ncbi:FixH family protein [Sediminicoccus sp. KRV36]|uniref:FixH family protein n=1 Tax=Sediminicoccus sp. KRV36 TaxID=3133721 RepID=UPI00200D6043|nr:FixH family protein [Sediminicoccus rosea]UPY37463.1 FixH family protein [Sediminicoccus rosea]